MNVSKVIELLNSLKRGGKLRDYAIFGAVAALQYMEPIYTSDIDILVLVSTDSEYNLLWREFSKHSQRVEGFGFITYGTEVQLFPTSISPLYESALKHAKKVKLNGIITKIVDREHLILMFLTSNRQKDKFRVVNMVQGVEHSYLDKLFEEFDKDGKLRQKLPKIY